MFSLASRAIVSVCRGSGGLVLNYWLSSSGGGGGREGRRGAKEKKEKKKKKKDQTEAYSTAALLLA